MPSMLISALNPQGSFAKVLVQDNPGHLQTFFDHALIGQSGFGRIRKAPF